jgi:hypothetical protein
MFRFDSRRNEKRAQALLTRIANHHCSQIACLYEGTREEPRVPLTMAVYVVPCKDGRPQVDLAFACATKEIATRGVALVVDEPVAFDEALLGMNCEQQMWWLHSEVRHVSPLGAGLWQVGLQICKLLDEDDCGPLKHLMI